MPTLQRRDDGGYFIRNYYRDHHTWQILAEGVRFLEFRGVAEGSSFSTELFMRLYMHGWVFTQGAKRKPIQQRITAAQVPEALHDALRAFHGALFCHDAGAVYEALWFGNPQKDNPEEITKIIYMDAHLEKWKLRDAVVLQIPEDHCQAVGAQELAVVSVRLSGGARVSDVTEFWAWRDGRWRVDWDSLARIGHT